MKLKVYFPTGKTVTYHNNLEHLMKSFDIAGISYQLVDGTNALKHSPR
ncbi:hypothetical protein [Vibrio hepatarius]|nr:hypothetical protein [Vibrio hepatarius]NIY81493.1 hypothetical protein [Vibrio hepatarius]NVJ55898.1 hypothetical protein [Vibrionaceae bacterium]